MAIGFVWDGDGVQFGFFFLLFWFFGLLWVTWGARAALALGPAEREWVGFWASVDGWMVWGVGLG